MQKIVIVDFGSQYTQLIARRVRELEVYCEILPFNKKIENLADVKGIILSGSPSSVLVDNAPNPNLSEYIPKIPILGICYGAQYYTKLCGGEVRASKIREYGRAILTFIDKETPLFKDVKAKSFVWMSHSDTIVNLPESIKIIASTEDVEVAGFQDSDKQVYGLQFHPEVYHSEYGVQILKNFVKSICKCSSDWTRESFIDFTVESLKQKIGKEAVIMGLSGGVDSTVAAVLLHKAVGDNLHCVFVDNGLLRKNEFKAVLEIFSDQDLNVKGVNASEEFYQNLKGVSDPEEKRKIIGSTFIKVFDREARKINNAKWLAQGTIYPDVIESISVSGSGIVTIKSHHNVGGLPKKLNLKIVEPLRLLFKDEVRKIGKELRLDNKFINRHPFPGPGLGIRILGNITPKKVRLLQEVDDIYIKSLKKNGFYNQVWQAGAILLPVQSVGVMGDERTYEYVVALRAVSSTDGMTADWSRLSNDFLAKVSNEIINKVKGVNRVVYDISSKPPATIEWE